MATFYLSSTYKDLKHYRLEVDAALRRAGHTVIGMENKAASGGAPLATCLADVAKCDAYIGIFAWRYGSIPEEGDPPGKSITELEYLQAIKCKKDTLIFLLREGIPLEPADSDATNILALRERLSKRHWIEEFVDCPELKEAVLIAANRVRRKRWWRKYAKVIFGAVALVGLVVTLLFAYSYWVKRPGRPIENKSEAGLNDIVRLNDWAARFIKSEKLEEHWTYPKEFWSTEPGEMAATNTDDEALLVRGQEMGIPNDLDGKQFQNFRALFKIRFKNGSEKAAWVLRAQPDQKGGYLFQLEQEGTTLFLSGWIYDRKQKGESLGKYPVRFGKIRESKSLTIDVVAQENSFSYDIKFGDDQPDKQIDPEEPNSGAFVVQNLRFEDHPNHVRWPLGTIGFKSTDDTSVMRVEYVYVYIIKR